jgi:hypothetical protein
MEPRPSAARREMITDESETFRTVLNLAWAG